MPSLADFILRQQSINTYRRLLLGVRNLSVDRNQKLKLQKDIRARFEKAKTYDRIAAKAALAGGSSLFPFLVHTGIKARLLLPLINSALSIVTPSHAEYMC